MSLINAENVVCLHHWTSWMKLRNDKTRLRRTCKRCGDAEFKSAPRRCEHCNGTGFATK